MADGGLVLAALTVSPGGVALLIVSVVAVIDMRFFYAAAYFTGGIFLVAAGVGVIIAVVHRYRSSAPVGSAIHFEGSTWFDTPAEWRIVLVVVAVSGAVMGTVMSVGTGIGRLRFETEPGRALFLTILFASIAVICVYTLARVALGFSRLSGLECTPEHLVIAGGKDEQKIAWADIARIATIRTVKEPGVRFDLRVGAAAEVTPYLRDPFQPTGIARQRTVVMPLGWAAPGVGPMLAFLEFYLAHPEHRAELGDGRAVERLLAGDLG